MRIIILNGPNLNLLGSRDPSKYGSETLADILDRCEALASELGVTLDHRQMNGEGELVTALHAVVGEQDGVILNAGAYSHTSIALRDAIAFLEVPVIEVHLSNIFAREAFRRHSVLSEVCTGVVAGFKGEGYLAALRLLVRLLQDRDDSA